MKVLRRYRLNNKFEVKFVQGWLNCFEGTSLVVDGGYGPATERAVKTYQYKYGLVVDGICGPATQMHMGFRQTRNPKIVALEIPFHKITKAEVLWKDGQPYNSARFAAESQLDIIWNGAFFERKTLEVVQLMMKSGVVGHWGMGYEGIAYPNLWSAPIGGSVFDFIGKPYDMQGSAPTLIDNYITDNQSIAAFGSAMMGQVTRRNCTALTTKSIVLFFSIANCTLYEMKDEGLFQRVLFMMGNDGGGSVFLRMGGADVLATDGRSIPAAVGLKVR